MSEQLSIPELPPGGSVIPEVLSFPIITVPKLQGLLSRIAADLEESTSLVVDSAGMAEIALEMVGRFATVRDALDKERLEKTKPLREGQARINGGYNPAIEFIEKAEKRLKGLLTEWDRRVKLEAARIQRELDAQRQREVAAADEQRIAAEREAAAKVAEAQAAQAAGDHETAAALLSEAQVQADAARSQMQGAMVAAHTSPPPLPQGVKGATVSWKARTSDKAKVILFVADMLQHGNKSYIDGLDVSESFWTSLARAQKENMSIPGIEAYPESGVRASRRAV
jgi:hypothetical protein